MLRLPRSLLSLLLISSVSFGTDWTFTIDSACTTINCNTSGTSGTGVWTATEGTSGASFSNGSYTRPSTGFLELTVPSGASSGTSGTWGSTPPFSAYAIEVPTVGIVSAPLFASESQPTLTVESPTCASANFNANFLAGQWSPSLDIMTSSSQMSTGYLSWTNATRTFLISVLDNVTNYENFFGSAGESTSMTASTCASNQYAFAGIGDHGGTAWVGSKSSIIYRSQVGHAFYGFPPSTIGQVGAVTGTYAALRYDSYASDSNPILPMYVIVTAGSGTSKRYSDPYGGTIATGGSALTETLTITSVDQPSTGMLEGTMTNGTTTSDVSCVVGLNLDNGTNTKNAIFCAGQSPSDATLASPYNLLMVSIKDYPGAIDKRFNNTGYVSTTYDDPTPSATFSYAHGSVTDSQGRYLVVGDISQTTSQSGTEYAVLVARYTSTGTLDATFGTAGSYNTQSDFVNMGPWNDAVYTSSGTGKPSIVLQTDGKILLVGPDNLLGHTVGIVRLTSNGSLDSSYGTSGISYPGSNVANLVCFPYRALLQTDGKIVTVSSGITPSSQDAMVVTRTNTDGSPDTTFGTSGAAWYFDGTQDVAYDEAIQTDGKIVVVGGVNWYANAGIIRLTTSGLLDTSFGTAGLVTDSTYSVQYNRVALQTDGKIVVGGTNASSGFQLARWTTNGLPDTTFDSTGTNTTTFGSFGEVRGLGIEADGKILAAGAYQPTASTWALVLARYTTDGALDTTYNGGTSGYLTNTFGTSGGGNWLSIQSDGTELVGGFTNDGTLDNFTVFRFYP